MPHISSFKKRNLKNISNFKIFKNMGDLAQSPSLWKNPPRKPWPMLSTMLPAWLGVPHSPRQPASFGSTFHVCKFSCLCFTWVTYPFKCWGTACRWIKWGVWDIRECRGLWWWEPWLREQMSPGAMKKESSRLCLTVMQGKAKSPDRIGTFWDFLNEQLIQNIAKTWW